MAVSKRLRYEILRRDGHACQYCGRSAPEVKLTVDHVKPTALGGSDEPSNLVAACQDCNSGKTSSNPDAPLVERVAEDALRWSQAINVAAEQMLTERDAFFEQLSEFDQAWRGWHCGPDDDRRQIPLPDGWKWSVERFLAAGLPMPILLDCVDKAMNTQRVKAAETFRYMCGIAWKKIEEIQKAAHNQVEDPPASTAAKPQSDLLLTGRAHLANELLRDFLTDDERALEMGAARSSLENAGDPFREEQVIIDAAYEAMACAVYDRQRLGAALEALLASFPSKELARAKAMADHQLVVENHTDPVTSAEMIGVATLWLAAHQSFVRLPKVEQEEWLACVAVSDETTPDPEFTAADYAERCKEFGYRALRGNCVGLGEHGAMCPRRAEVKAVLQGRCQCASDTRSCDGHPMCRSHAEDEVREEELAVTEAQNVTVDA